MKCYGQSFGDFDFCIAALIGLSGFLVYNTLDTGRDSISRIESVSEPAGETEELQFNRDTSITKYPGERSVDTCKDRFRYRM